MEQVYTFNAGPSVQIDFLVRNDKEKLQYEGFSEREIETQIWIKSFQENGVFLDVGANIGLFSILASQIHPDLKVISFEPHIPCFETLFQNIKINKSENVLPINIALSNKNELNTFNYMKTQSGTAKSVFGKSIDYQGNEFNPQLSLPALSLKGDTFFEIYNLEIPNYIKIDVDGIEMDVLQGMTNILKSSNLKSIMVEANSERMEQELHLFMLKYGFKIFQIQNKNWKTAKTRNNFFERN